MGGGAVSFERIWTRIQPRLRRLLAARGIPSDVADDVLQDTALKLLRSWSRVEPNLPLWPLARTVALNCVVDHYRRSVEVPVGDVPDRPAPGDAEERGLARARLSQARVALTTLRPADQSVLLAEIGLAVRRDNTSAARMARWRARHKLLQALPAKQRVRAEKGLRRGRSYYCTTLGQARGLAALWIAAQATPETRGTVRRVAADTPYGVDLYEHEGQRFAFYGGPFMPLYPLAPPPMWDRVQFADAEFHYAASLLDRPADKVASVFAQHWDDVLQPTTSTAHVLDDLGLAPHPTIEEQVAALPDDVKVERGTLRGGATISDSIPCF